jgi:hypothetical protein
VTAWGGIHYLFALVTIIAALQRQGHRPNLSGLVAIKSSWCFSIVGR